MGKRRHLRGIWSSWRVGRLIRPRSSSNQRTSIIQTVWRMVIPSLLFIPVGVVAVNVLPETATLTALGFLILYFRQGIVNFFEAVTGQALWDPSVRFLTELPARVDPAEVIGICVLAMVLSFLATLYPAYKAANTDPVQVLRYE